MLFIKENLVRADYDWSTNNASNGLKDSTPNRNRFDRFNGFSMLRMINLFSRLVADISIKQGQQIEQIISKELPLMLTSEVSVFNWLKGRFAFTTATATSNKLS